MQIAIVPRSTSLEYFLAKIVSSILVLDSLAIAKPSYTNYFSTCDYKRDIEHDIRKVD